MEKRNQFRIASAVYVLLMLLAWATISGVSIRVAGAQIGVRGPALAIIAFFSVRTALHAQRWRLEQGSARHDGADFEGHRGRR